MGERIALIGNDHESSSAPVQKVDALPKRIVSQEKVPARQPKPDEIQHAHKTATSKKAIPKQCRRNPSRLRLKGRRAYASKPLH